MDKAVPSQSPSPPHSPRTLTSESGMHRNSYCSPFSEFCISSLTPLSISEFSSFEPSVHWPPFTDSPKLQPKNLSFPVKPGPREENKKPTTCNCKKSKCLKLYCDCFTNGSYCIGCSCKQCANKEEFEFTRKEIIQKILEKNPDAFQPKVSAIGDRIHNKGCNCQKSECLKKYCECYLNQASCTPLCRCRSCKNSSILLPIKKHKGK